MNKNVGVSAGLLALMAVVLRVSNPPSGEKARGGETRPRAVAGTPAEKTPAESEGPETPLEGPWLATRTYFQSQGPDKMTGAVAIWKTDQVDICSQSATCRPQLQKFFGLPKAAKPCEHCEFLIATVPDPLHTRLALFTDASLQALQKAAEAARWEFAAQWLPWFDAPGPGEKEPAKRRREWRDVRYQETQPGLLIFRHQPDGDAKTFDDRVLFIFIVGETPTAGVNGSEFKLARAYTTAFRNPASVRVQGPTFSGSFASLASLINEDKQQHGGHGYMVQSGNAVNDGYATAFAESTGAKFFGTTVNATDQRNHFREVLRDLHIRPEEAAMLIEEETGYAHAPSFKSSGPDKDPDSAIPLLRFPREISHLRNAYREAVQASRSRNSPTPDINFSLKDPESGEDSVPVFSKTQTPLSQNAVLGEITHEIKRQRIRIVYVMATNVLDLMFLAEVLRRLCPDTRLLIASPDLLFVQQTQLEPLDGTLAMSAYPLFAAGKRWTGADGLTHSDMNSEGVYNATLLLLAQSGDDSQSQPDQEILGALTDYGWGTLRHPPVWLMTLTRTGFSPLRAMKLDNSSQWWQEIEPRPSSGPAPLSIFDRPRQWISGLRPAPGAPTEKDLSLRLPDPPRIWTLVVSLLSIFSLASAAGLAFLHFKPRVKTGGSFVIDAEYEEDWPRLFCLLLSVLSLSAMQAILYFPLLLHSGEDSHTAIQLFMLTGFLAPILVVSPLMVRLCREKATHCLAVVLALAGFAEGLAIWTLCCGGGGNQAFFFSFRSLELQTGSSPAIPVLAAVLALFVFCVTQLIRFDLINRRPSVSKASFTPALQARLANSLHRFDLSMQWPHGFPWRRQITWGFLIAGVTAGACLICRVHVNLSSADDTLFDVLSMGLQISLVLAIALSAWQLNVAWSALHSFLHNLKMLPMASAFTKLDREAGKSPIWVHRLNLQSLDIPVSSVRVLHDMRLVPQEQLDEVEVLREDVEGWLKDYLEALKPVLDEEENGAAPLDASGTGKTRSQARREFCRLTATSRLLADAIGARVLLRQWRTHPVPWAQSVDNESESEGKPSAGDVGNPRNLCRLGEGFLALHFSAFAIYGVRQIKNLLCFISLGFVLLMVSMNSYSFQSRQMIGRFLTVMFVLLSYIAGKCMVQMERDSILSRISGSTAGELNKDFYIKMVTYGALPVLGILASLFPSMSNFVFSWLEPTLEALR